MCKVNGIFYLKSVAELAEVAIMWPTKIHCIVPFACFDINTLAVVNEMLLALR